MRWITIGSVIFNMEDVSFFKRVAEYSVVTEEDYKTKIVFKNGSSVTVAQTEEDFEVMKESLIFETTMTYGKKD